MSGEARPLPAPYDDAGQLMQLTELAPDGTTVIYSGTHSYDAAGQLTGETVNPGVVPATVNVTQTFDADNRLLTHNGAATTFDADGNMLSIASGVAPASYTYDARNRLTTAGGLTYGYNAENRRTSVTDSAGTTSYVVNPNAVLDQVLVQTAPSGTKTFYVYGVGLLHEETGSAIRYYHHDRRGDTIALTDSTGTVTDRTSYGIYGEIHSRTGTTNTPFLFNGRWGVQTDANDIYYHRARYYQPQLRRFLNQDTLLSSITAHAGLNRFSYANGNPVSLVDPFGTCAEDSAPNPAAPNNAATTTSSTSTGGIRAPDFTSVSLSIPIPNPFTGLFLGVGVSFTGSRDGNTFFSLNVVAGVPSAAGASVVGGWLNTSAKPAQSQTNEVLSQWGAGASGGYIVGPGFYGNSSGTATTVGFTTPGVSAYGGYTWQTSVHTPTWGR